MASPAYKAGGLIFYSLLKTVEDIFHLPLLGDAKQPQVRAFGKDVFTG